MKNKTYSLINVLGLSIGICALLLVTSYYQFERSFDQFYSEEYAISRVILKQESRAHTATLPYYVGDGLKQQIVEINSSTRLSTSTLKSVVKLGSSENKVFDEFGIAFADDNYFEFFEKEFLKGNAGQFKGQPNAVVLTANTASRYFGHTDPIGQLIELVDDEMVMEVVGVIADSPDNSSIQFSMICSMDLVRNHANKGKYWFTPNVSAFQTFIKTSQDIDFSLLNAKVDEYAQEGWIEISKRARELSLEPLTDLHLRSDTNEPFYRDRGDLQLINWFFGIAVVIMIMGIVNYGNLTMATTLRRAKEVGIRKVVGASRLNVFYQFLAESLLMGGFVFITSLLMFELLTPYFEVFVDQSFSQTVNFQSDFYLFSLALSLGTSLVSGLYPAFMLSKVHSVSLLKGANSVRFLSTMRSALLLTQFLIGFVLVATALYINDQLNFVLSKELGFKTENRLAIKHINAEDGELQLLKTEVERINGVTQITMADFYPGVKGFTSSAQQVELVPGNGKQKLLILGVDPSFLNFYEIEVLVNNGLDPETLFGKASNFALLNQEALKVFGIEDPIGLTFPPIYRGQKDFVVQGVVKDFHVGSLHQEVPPVAIIPIAKAGFGATLSIEYSEQADLGRLLNEVETTYRKIVDSKPFMPVFLESEQTQLYVSENRMRQLVNILTGLGVFIALAGVLGLTLSATEHRQKEISIRKILGASIWQLQITQNKQFLVLIVLSFVVGIPISLYAINFWKTDFAYRLEISPWLFVISLLVMVLCTFATSGWLTLKTSKKNPSEILHYE